MVWNRSIAFLAGIGACLLNSVSSAQQPVVNEVYTQAIPYESAAEACSSCGTSEGCGCESVDNTRWQPGSLGFLKQSDHCFSDFISPMTNPVFFEDPRNNTEARAIYLNHRVPTAAGGGNVQLFALQLRARLTENISLIATKDGYVTSNNPLVQDGWADLAAGLKFSLLRDPEAGRLLSAGFTYELPTGEADPLQGNGDGELNLFVTGGRRIGDRSHWISAGGWRIPFDGDAESESLYWSNHLDYRVTNRMYALAELNWFNWVDSGTGGIPGVEGQDLFNFGSSTVTGNDVVTAAVGTKFKANRHSEFGVAFEFPLTNRRDIIDNRLTLDYILRY